MNDVVLERVDLLLVAAGMADDEKGAKVFASWLLASGLQLMEPEAPFQLVGQPSL